MRYSPRIGRSPRIRRRAQESAPSGDNGVLSWKEGSVGEKTRLLAGHLQTSSPSTVSEVPVASMLAPASEPPALLIWLVPALVCALCYALYNIFIKKGSASIHPILGGVILQIVAAMLGILLCSFLTYGPPHEKMFYDMEGISWAILAGLAVGAAEILSFVVNGMGVPAVKSIPIIIGGSVMFGTIIGRIFLAEILSLRGWSGVLLIAIGVTLVGMEAEGEM